MKLAISNIAWQKTEEKVIASKLSLLGVKYVEIAPTKIWNDPLKVSDKEVEKYKNFWGNFGIKIIAMQSLLYNHPELMIFDGKRSRKRTLDYLSAIIELGGRLGVRVLVFGSPKNRNIDPKHFRQSKAISLEFFEALGKKAEKENVIFCIEPNPQIYECNFINNAKDGLEFVRKVGSNGFKLHLDTAAMTLSGENISPNLELTLPETSHFHISEPYLGLITDNKVDHQLFANALKKNNYDNFVSIEMKALSMTDNIQNVVKSVLFVQDTYNLTK